jgi:Tfp pilus assembly protein PilN
MLITNLEAQNVRRTREQAQAEQINWREAFRELTLVVPNGMWLSEMGGQGAEAQPPGLPPQEGDIPIRIRGVAVSQGVVADLLVNLEMSSHFRDPTVIYTQRQGGQEVGRVGFEIQCGLRRAPIGGLAAGETA